MCTNSIAVALTSLLFEGRYTLTAWEGESLVHPLICHVNPLVSLHLSFAFWEEIYVNSLRGGEPSLRGIAGNIYFVHAHYHALCYIPASSSCNIHFAGLCLNDYFTLSLLSNTEQLCYTTMYPLLYYYRKGLLL